MRQKISRFLARVTPQQYFIVLALVFGLFLVIVTPPFQGTDEPAHFLRAYAISSGELRVDQQPKFNAAGEYLPDSLSQLFKVVGTPSINFHPDLKYSERLTLNALKIKTDAKKRQFYDMSATAIYSPISYTPQSLGILAGRILHLPLLLLVYAGRTAGLIAWVIIVYLAIRIMPVKKWVVAMIGLLPMALFQASTINTDVMAIGSVLLFAVFVFRLVYDKQPLSRNQLLILLGLGLIMSLSKQVLFVFLPLVLLLRQMQLGSTRRAILFKLLIIGIPIIAAAIWYVISTHGVNLASSLSNGANPHGQLSLIAHNPYTFINAMWNTYFYYWSDVITISFIGSFGWVDAPLSAGFVMFGYVMLLAATVIHSGEKQIFSRRDKLIMLLTAFAYIGAVSLSLFAYFNPIGYKIITGLQGRYFLPALIVLGMTLTGTWLKASAESYRKIVMVGPLVLLAASAITIFVRYFVHNV